MLTKLTKANKCCTHFFITFSNNVNETACCLLSSWKKTNPCQSFKLFKRCTGGVSALQAEPLENAIYNWRFLCLRLKSKCVDRLNQPLRQIFFKEEKKAVETNSKQLWRQTGSFNLTGNQLLKLQTDYLFYKIKNKLEPNYNVDKNNDHHHFNSSKKQKNKKWPK